MPRASTWPTSARSSGRTPTRCRPAGCTSRPGTTAGRAAWCCRARPSAGRAARPRAPAGGRAFEAELGCVVGTEGGVGEPVAVSRFGEHVFGVCLVNDWSARDLQAFESVPLGPFLGKSFGTTVSPWILPLAALEHARVRPPSRDTELAEYLTESEDWGL